jgi:hypothetical protein
MRFSAHIAIISAHTMHFSAHKKPENNNHRESKSFDPLITRMVDDLLRGQNDGYPINDHSLPESRRAFTCKIILLYIIGDYPGQGKLCGFSHMGTFIVHYWYTVVRRMVHSPIGTRLVGKWCTK